MKWLLLTVALLLVIAISVGATLLFTRDGDNPPTAAPPTSKTPPVTRDVASANDTGPVSVITEDPTCDPWRPIGDTLAAQQRSGWDQRDPAIPASKWTPEQTAQYEAVAQAMLRAADQTVALVEITPHRAMRLLYEQSIAYWRAYANAIPDYTPSDDELALVANAASSAIVSICAAIDFGSADARGPLAGQTSPMIPIPPINDPAQPYRFLTHPAEPICSDWTAAYDKFTAVTAAWRQVDPNIPASQWSIAQRMTNDAVAGVMLTFAENIAEMGQSSKNPTLADFAALSAQYWRAYALALPSYTPADNYLSQTGSRLAYMVSHACAAARS